MSKRRKITAAGLAVIIVVIVIAAAVLLPKLNQPASGVIKSSDSPVKSGYTINLKPKKATGKYLSFNYPSGLTAQKTDPVTAPNVEILNFLGRDVTTWLLAVNVSTPRGGLSGDSGFAYRKANPSIYQESHTTVNNQPVDIMTDKTANFSKVAYISHGPLLATVSLHGDDAQGTQPLQTSFDMVLNSLRWL